MLKGMVTTHTKATKGLPLIRLHPIKVHLHPHPHPHINLGLFQSPLLLQLPPRALKTLPLPLLSLLLLQLHLLLHPRQHQLPCR